MPSNISLIRKEKDKSTQNNYSPSFGLKKLVIFFILCDKTDKNSAEAGSTKHAAERSEGMAKAWRLIKGEVGPRAQLPRKAQETHKMPGV